MADRPVFVLGERAAALRLVQTLGETDHLTAMPFSRLLSELAAAADRCAAAIGPAADVVRDSLDPAAWYGEVQAAQRLASGKGRTVEFSGLSVLRLCSLFPAAQFVVVRRRTRAMPPSRRLPSLERRRIIEIDAESLDRPGTLDLVLEFLGEPARELDLSDGSRVANPRAPIPHR